jgi:hypothetical protein
MRLNMRLRATLLSAVGYSRLPAALRHNVMDSGQFAEPSELTRLKTFITSFATYIAA